MIGLQPIEQVFRLAFGQARNPDQEKGPPILGDTGHASFSRLEKVFVYARMA
jgi:hypothetical protein